ncbi:MAG: hypothetical protein SVW51_10980 [Pseudomonadota bacterium]|nr:hypothetical protein [Pseudomonadota bacterium]
MSFKLSETTQGIKWINHFNGSDKIYAQQLLDGITWISSNEFSSTLRESIEEHAKEFKGPIGLLIERELRRNGHGVQRFYKQKKNPKQAFGAALQPIESKKYSKHQVGSEGIIASLATELSREHSSKFFLHPTVKQLKELKIEAFFILT